MKLRFYFAEKGKKDAGWVSKVSELTLVSQRQKQRDGGRIRCELQVQCGALTEQPTFWDIIHVRVKERWRQGTVSTAHN